MNRAMSRVFTVAALLFVVLVVNLTWLMAVRADWFRARPENKRSIAKEMKIKRGDILGFDGSVMAGTVLTILPVLILFLILQRQMIKGLTSGAVKS